MTKAKAKTQPKAKAKTAKQITPNSNNLNALVAKFKSKGIKSSFKRIKKEHYDLTVMLPVKGKKTKHYSGRIIENATKAECDDFFNKALKAFEV